MKVRYLIWDKINLKHIARHRVERYEVDEAILTGKPFFRKGRAKIGIMLMGVPKRADTFLLSWRTEAKGNSM
ncbi:MAG: hypothetical protein ACUVV0_16650 [Anaerolineae bacterium]